MFLFEWTYSYIMLRWNGFDIEISHKVTTSPIIRNLPICRTKENNGERTRQMHKQMKKGTTKRADKKQMEGDW